MSDLPCADCIDNNATIDDLRTQLAAAQAEVKRLRTDPRCLLARPGRGDCEHFIGLPGQSIPGQHDGPDTEDAYGKPNGWCWFCWNSYQLDRKQKEVTRLREVLAWYGDRKNYRGIPGVDALPPIRDDFGQRARAALEKP